MILQILLIIVSIAIVLAGANLLTNGASGLARRMNIPEIVIGLTIVACGTSMPEFFVSFISALNHTPDLAVGNIVGSNIFNALLIVGVAAMVAPITISKSTVTKDIPFAIGSSLLLIILITGFHMTLNISGAIINRIDGVILTVSFFGFMAYTLRLAKNGKAEDTAVGKRQPIWKGILFIVLGLAALIVGSDLFVSEASSIAGNLGVSESVIGLTIVAGGTSLPELATSVVAARKGQSAIAIGNVLGSNVFNILMILGITGMICPMQIQGITIYDLGVMLVSMILIWLFSFTRYTIARWEGVLLTFAYLIYMYWLLQ
jgi:cation:H+ antiporter